MSCTKQGSNDVNIGVINISNPAKERIKQLLVHNPDPNLGLKVYIIEQNCSGIDYVIAFEPPEAEDLIFNLEGIKLIIDPISLSCLHGATIDYGATDQGMSFFISNLPKNNGCCGCNANACC